MSSTIIGARTTDQLNSNLAADDVLTAVQLGKLAEVRSAPQGFTAMLASPAIRATVFGGHTVKGWGNRR